MGTGQPNLGNVWHLPEKPEPRGCGGMRDPIGVVVAGAELIARSGNQFAGPGNAADQLQDGSAVLARRAPDADWAEFPALPRGAGHRPLAFVDGRYVLQVRLVAS